jgi:tRNA A-37 threonylcarbamoyl transferase component Bud32/tetratricopeptide (TPR) repeat protein
VTPPSTTGHTIFGGRYAVEAPLGSGATATVYLCRDQTTAGAVAVKVLHTDLAESVGAERFLREIRLTSGLDHPSILPVIDSGADGSTLYCVLPFMEGGTLRDLLREKKQLAITEAIEIGKTIAEALAYAHDRGLIHRDIKPENILFSKGKAYLGDFGIARALYATASDLTTTTTGVIRGTPAYMSPEQASGERNYDGRSDIYSLGAVVYEMISGMPPFVGPTAQSVMAQRFSSTPREMRVYRSSVPPAIEAVVSNSMMTAPADRFSSARELVDALETAKTAPAARRARPPIVIGTVAGAVLVVAVFFASKLGMVGGAPPVRSDTTQLAVLPFEYDSSASALGSVDAFVYDAFSAWRGMTVLEPFQVRDAVARKASLSGVERDRSVALALGAGRFVRGSVVRMPGGAGWKVFAWLHQVRERSDTLLFNASVEIRPEELDAIGGKYATLARLLLLRGGDSASGSAVVATTDLPAMQFFTRGITAVDDWNFALADSLFESAIARDPRYGRAYLWQAQVRFWQRASPTVFAPLAEKALVDTTRLPPRDLQLARALASLGAKDYDAACREYEQLRQKNDADFAAWFGLGRCRDLDFRIERDAKSPTGWRYHSSYADAVASYEKAFAVLSLSHRSLERGAFEPLRELLFMRPGKLQLAVRPPSDTGPGFVGRLDWESGKPILRPVPIALVTASDPAGVPPGMRQAIQSQQRLFRNIAREWSTALPGAAGAKEAMAVALEMEGNRGALDTLRAARSLATDADARLRLASAEIVLRLKLLDPADSVSVRAIRNSADSLLASYPSPGRVAPQLAPLAAMLGRCDQASSLAARNPAPAGARDIPVDVVAAAESLLVRETLGCGAATDHEVQQLRSRMDRSGIPSGSASALLTRLVQATDLRYPALTASWPASTYLMTAQQAALQRRRDVVHATMARRDSARTRTGYDDVAPDAIYLESSAQLAVGDTAAAIVSLDRLLERLPFLTPGLLNRPVEMSGLMRAIQLRGDIAAKHPEAGPAARWAAVRRVLWQPK